MTQEKDSCGQSEYMQKIFQQDFYRCPLPMDYITINRRWGNRRKRKEDMNLPRANPIIVLWLLENEPNELVLFDPSECQYTFSTRRNQAKVETETPIYPRLYPHSTDILKQYPNLNSA
jgi:hypothetical protein